MSEVRSLWLCRLDAAFLLLVALLAGSSSNVIVKCELVQDIHHDTYQCNVLFVVLLTCWSLLGFRMWSGLDQLFERM